MLCIVVHEGRRMCYVFSLVVSAAKPFPGLSLLLLEGGEIEKVERIWSLNLFDPSF